MEDGPRGRLIRFSSFPGRTRVVRVGGVRVCFDTDRGRGMAGYVLTALYLEVLALAGGAYLGAVWWSLWPSKNREGDRLV